MAISINTLIYVIVGIAGAFLIRMYYSAPDAPYAGADIADRPSISTRRKSDLDAVDSSTVSNRVVSENPDLIAGGGTPSKSLKNINDPSTDPIDSFSDHMGLQGAKAEAYLLVRNALQTDHLAEFKDPEQFDGLVAIFEQNADATAYETAGRYMRELNSIVADHGSSVIVGSVACGGLVCAARFESPNTEDLDQFRDKYLEASASVPMYAVVEMPRETNGGYDVRRLIFTTDPSANAFEMPLQTNR